MAPLWTLHLFASKQGSETPQCHHRFLFASGYPASSKSMGVASTNNSPVTIKTPTWKKRQHFRDLRLVLTTPVHPQPSLIVEVWIRQGLVHIRLIRASSNVTKAQGRQVISISSKMCLENKWTKMILGWGLSQKYHAVLKVCLQNHTSLVNWHFAFHKMSKSFFISRLALLMRSD